MIYDDASALILAGGTSRRFGTDKARYAVAGRSMIEHVYTAADGVVRVVRISVRGEKQSFDLPVEHVPDEVPDAGPLGGLHAGLLRNETPWLLIVACDLPFITENVLREILEVRAEQVDAVVARTPDGRLHPHCACYHARVLGYVALQLKARRLALHALLRRLPVVREVAVPGGALHNVNYRRDIE